MDGPLTEAEVDAETEEYLALIHPNIADTIRADEGLMSAARYSVRLRAQPDVDYGWVADLARQTLSGTVAEYKRMDDKAASVVTWVGTATSAVALTAALATAKGELPTWPSLALLPALAFGLVAVRLAIHARCANKVLLADNIAIHVKLAEEFKDTARTTLLGELHLAEKYMTALLFKRARLVDQAMKWAFWAAVGFVLPLVVAIGIKACEKMTQPLPDRIPYSAS